MTRPIQDGEKIAFRLKAMGHEALVAPLLAVEFLDATLDLAGVQAILATSANGVRAFARLSPRRDLPLFAVGPQTADEARSLGFGKVQNANGDVRDLAEAVPGWAAPEAGALLDAAGESAGDTLAQLLSAKGFRVVQARLYRMKARMQLPREAVEALEQSRIEAALFFSPKSAAHFAQCAARDRLPTEQLVAICISANTAQALRGLSFAEIRVAGAPNQDALLACL